MASLIREGYVNVLFGGNGLATHDIEMAMFGTSLGVSLSEGIPQEGGHEHHLRAINRVRRAGSIARAVEQGLIDERHHARLRVQPARRYILAGSIRDDGPLPDVVTDTLEAQRLMRAEVHKGVDLVLVLSSMLHGIATGNLLSAAVTTVCVDINPAVVTKLADRGSFQAIGLVMDVEGFLAGAVRGSPDLARGVSATQRLQRSACAACPGAAGRPRASARTSRRRSGRGRQGPAGPARSACATTAAAP